MSQDSKKSAILDRRDEHTVWTESANSNSIIERQHTSSWTNIYIHEWELLLVP